MSHNTVLYPQRVMLSPRSPQPVASDSGSTNVGIEKGMNQPGEKEVEGELVGSCPREFEGN